MNCQHQVGQLLGKSRYLCGHVSNQRLTSFLRYITDNPGAWLFHCHIQWHLVVSCTSLKNNKLETNHMLPLQSGMALVLVEGDSFLPGLVDASHNPLTSDASSTTSTKASGISTTMGTIQASMPISTTNGASHSTTDGVLVAIICVLLVYSSCV